MAINVRGKNGNSLSNSHKTMVINAVINIELISHGKKSVISPRSWGGFSLNVALISQKCQAPILRVGI